MSRDGIGMAVSLYAKALGVSRVLGKRGCAGYNIFNLIYKGPESMRGVVVTYHRHRGVKTTFVKHTHINLSE